MTSVAMPSPWSSCPAAMRVSIPDKLGRDGSPIISYREAPLRHGHLHRSFISVFLYSKESAAYAHLRCTVPRVIILRAIVPNMEDLLSRLNLPGGRHPNCNEFRQRRVVRYALLLAKLDTQQPARDTILLSNINLDIHSKEY